MAISEEIVSSKSQLLKQATREDLYKLVWSEPMLKVAARFGVSSSYMARICTLLNVPRPERGYWAKAAVGKAPPKPSIPDAQPGDVLIWERGGQNINMERPLPRPPSKNVRKHSKKPKHRPSRHSLITGAKEHFKSGRLSYETGYLKPAKWLLVDLAVTKTGLEKALSFANELFLALEDKGYHVVIAPNDEKFHRAEVDEHEKPRKKGYNNLWSPMRCTVVYIGTVAIGLTIIEMSEEIEVRYVNGKYIPEKDYQASKRNRYERRHTWTTFKDFPTGRLCLQAYSPYWRTNWIKHWRETKKRGLDRQIKSIVREIGKAAENIAGLVEKARRQAEIEQREWEAQRARWEKEEVERRAAKALQESRAELLQIIEGWAESNRIEKFFKDAETRASELSDEDRVRIIDRLKLARKMIGSTDALDRFLRWRSPDER